MMNEYHPPLPRRGSCECPVDADGRPMRTRMFRAKDIVDPYRPLSCPDPYHYVICVFAGEVSDEKLDGILTCLTWNHAHNDVIGLGPSYDDRRISDWVRGHEKSCRYQRIGHLSAEHKRLTPADALPQGVDDRFDRNLYSLMAGYNGRNVHVVLVGDTAGKNNPVWQAVVDSMRRLAQGWRIRYVEYTDDTADERLRALGETPLWERNAEDARKAILKLLDKSARQTTGPVTLGEAIAAERPEMVRVSSGTEHFVPIRGKWRVDDISPTSGRHRDLTYNETIALMRRTVTNRIHHDDMVFYEI